MIVQNMAAICPYRVGDYLHTENPTHPATSWPGTSWVQLQGRMLMGASDTYPVGSEGGEAQHTLTQGEMPSHTHVMNGWVIGTEDKGAATGLTVNAYPLTHNNSNQTTKATGGDQPHNNLPPYRAVYIWRRTS